MSKKPAASAKTAAVSKKTPQVKTKKPRAEAATAVARPGVKKALEKISVALNKLKIASYDGRVPGWMTSGDWVTDLMLSMGRGYPLGRIVHLYGRKHTGKTVRALAPAAQFLANGGLVYWFNQESGWDEGLAITMGVDPSHPDFNLYPPQHLEVCADAIVEIVKSFKGVDVPVMIVLDSLGGSCSESRDDKAVEDGRTVSEIARIARDFTNKLVPHLELTKCLVLITNHTWLDFTAYTRPGMPKPEKPSGGEAVPFYAAIELKIARGQAEKTKEGPLPAHGDRSREEQTRPHQRVQVDLASVSTQPEQPRQRI